MLYHAQLKVKQQMVTTVYKKLEWYVIPLEEPTEGGFAHILLEAVWNQVGHCSNKAEWSTYMVDIYCLC